MNALALSDINVLIAHALHPQGHWIKRPGAAISIALHGIAIGAVILFAGHANAPPPDRAIELVLAPPAPPKLIVPPEPPKVLQPVRAPEPVHRAAPTPVRQAPAPRPAVVTQPTTPTPVAATETAPEPTPPAPPAPPVAAAPHAVGMSGIPTDYVNEVYQRINGAASGNYPRAARSMHIEGQVKYTLTLKPDGSLVNCHIQSSGQSVLDAAAEQAVRAAAPFPKLPDLGGTSYELTGVIGYQLDG